METRFAFDITIEHKTELRVSLALQDYSITLTQRSLSDSKEIKYK